MQQELLPLFPLSVVLFPRTQLPLHIFEDRYKDMIGEAIRKHTEFGVVLAAEKGVVNTGCTAVVDEVTNRYPDGRLDIVSTGVRRFEILTLDTEKEYLRGAVRFFNDEETGLASDDLKQKVSKCYAELREFADEAAAEEPEWNDPQLSFQLAQVIPDLEFRQQLLMLRSENERIEKLAEFIPLHLSRQRRIAHARHVSPRNGHGPHIPEM